MAATTITKKAKKALATAEGAAKKVYKKVASKKNIAEVKRVATKVNKYAKSAAKQVFSKKNEETVKRGAAKVNKYAKSAVHKIADKVKAFHFEKGGKVPSFVPTVKFSEGDRVWDIEHNTYATVLDNYGNPLDGDRGEIRVDMDGNVNIFTYDSKYNRIGYNLIKQDQSAEILADRKAINKLKEKRNSLPYSQRDKRQAIEDEIYLKEKNLAEKRTGLELKGKTFKEGGNLFPFEKGEKVIVTLTKETDGKQGEVEGVIIERGTGSSQLVEYTVDGKKVKRYKDNGETVKKYEEGGAIAEPITLTRNQEIAKDILHLLGGKSRLNAMTGAYDIYAIENGVRFKIRNAKANYIKIVLNTLDLYNIEVGKIRDDKYSIVGTGSNLQTDQIVPFLQEETGLRLSLFENGGTIK